MRGRYTATAPADAPEARFDATFDAEFGNGGPDRSIEPLETFTVLILSVMGAWRVDAGHTSSRHCISNGHN